MRRIVTTTFVTLDGVMQGLGGPEEDRDGGFAYGGWSATYWDEMMRNTINRSMELPFELLLGKRTYSAFAAYWPYETKEKNQPVAKKFNATGKYVVSK